MLDDLKNWLRERFEREEYFEYMTGQDPSSPAWLIMMAVGGALLCAESDFSRVGKSDCGGVGCALFGLFGVYLGSGKTSP